MFRVNAVDKALRTRIGVKAVDKGLMARASRERDKGLLITRPGTFHEKSVDLPDSKGFEVLGSANEFATVSKDRGYGWDRRGLFEVTRERVPQNWTLVNSKL